MTQPKSRGDVSVSLGSVGIRVTEEEDKPLTRDELSALLDERDRHRAEIAWRD